jgi:hypothetical protein
MNAVTAPFRQLVERRLWPVALLLVAALAAVPVLLAKDASSDVPAPTPVAAADAAADPGTTTTLVSASDPAQADEVRKVLGARKNPFRPAYTVKAKASSTATAGGDTGATGGTSSGATSGGSSGATTTPATTPTTTVTTPTTTTPKKTYETYSLEVAFGDSSGALAHREVKRLTGLPGGAPALLYLGLMDDHKTAVFLVGEGVKVQGDGACEPTGDDCQTLRMKAGDTVFLTRTNGKQYELDLIKVHARTTTSAAAAKKANASEAKGGRATLRDNLDRVGRYRYSERSGALKVLTGKAWASAKASSVPSPATGSVTVVTQR